MFRAIASSDHFTPATSKTIAITISKNGATSFSNPNAGATNATEMASGFYKFTLDTTDTGTVGPLAWRGAGTGIDDVGDVFEVVKATNAGFSALPDTACTTNASLITSGTSTDQLSVTSGRIDIGKALGTAVTLDANNVLNVSAKYWAGTAITATSIPVGTAAGAAGGLFIAGSNAATTISGLTTGALSCTTITASGAVAFQSTFAVTTSTSLAALSATTVTFSGAVAFQSTFAVTTSTSLAALSCTTLTASGAVAFQSTFATTGTTTLNALTVTNATTLSGAVSLGSTLGVTGTTTLAALTTTGTATLNAFTVSNATTLTGAVTASNASNNIVGIDVAHWNGLATVALPLVPTTAGRTLDVSATGEAGIDWANVGSPTAAVGLTGTTIATSQVVASVTGAVGSVTGNVGGNVVGSVGSVTGAVGSVTGSVGSVVGLTASNLDTTVSSRATPAQILTTALTESYAALHTAPTLAQAIFWIQQSLTERSIVSVTETIKKVDGSTTAGTLTLNDATTPTSFTRAT